MSGAGDIYKTFAVNVLLPIIFVSLTGMLGWVNKIEDRMYAMQASNVTEQKLENTEKRIMSYIDVRMKELDNKLDLVIRTVDNANKRD